MFQIILGWVVIAVGVTVLSYGFLGLGNTGTLFSPPEANEAHTSWILVSFGFLFVIYGIDLVFLR